MNSYAKALHFFRDAYSILYDHCPRMLSRAEWNLAGKTAYDAMEKVAKSVELLAGVHVTKQHDVRLRQAILERLPLVAWRVDYDPMNSVSFCVRKGSSPDLHVKLFKAVHGTLTELGARGVQSLANLSLVNDGSTITIYSSSIPVMAVTDTTAGLDLQGRWIQVAIDAAQIDVLNKYLAEVSRRRNTSAYYAELYSRGKATVICEDGRKLFLPVKRSVGYRIGGTPTF